MPRMARWLCGGQRAQVGSRIDVVGVEYQGAFEALASGDHVAGLVENDTEPVVVVWRAGADG